METNIITSLKNKTMEASFVLFKALKHCATRYNDKDISEWSEKASFVQMSVDIAEELSLMGYCLQRTSYPLPEIESELTTHEGE